MKIGMERTSLLVKFSKTLMLNRFVIEERYENSVNGESELIPLNLSVAW